jgi:hypothetical protein
MKTDDLNATLAVQSQGPFVAHVARTEGTEVILAAVVKRQGSNVRQSLSGYDQMEQTHGIDPLLIKRHPTQS